MHVIDDEGRVFGIINIIDLLVFLMVFFLIVGVLWLSYTDDLFRDFDPNKKEYVSKIVDVTFSRQSSAITALLNDSSGITTNPRITITNISSVKESMQSEICVGRPINDSYDITVRAELKTYSDRNTHTLYYYNDSLHDGLSVNLNIGNLTIVGNIIAIR